ncbi:hypothetical protein Agub_g10301 [Astrephomene gubernaculifera]|uniref:Uncharacterized protein n=1 Tax=Astrephomene gubernaculifera TaxID=47775 RepID=A0AAD3DWH3_9CHLO|nr:hypothetical protein Agub_g10301 [Astrephomene gubernaculifera]
MCKDASLTPKGTLTIKDASAGFGKGNVAATGLATLKYKCGGLNASLALSDASVKSIKTLKDVVATADYKVKQVKGTTLNTKYDLGTKKYQVGATWEGSLAKKATTVKLWYGNKDNKVAGEATVSLVKNQKANVTFNQQKVLTAKYTLANGDFTYEPSYNFDKQAPAVAISKKQGKDNFKLLRPEERGRLPGVEPQAAQGHRVLHGHQEPVRVQAHRLGRVRERLQLLSSTLVLDRCLS